MLEDTPLERACNIVAGELHQHFYDLLGNLLLLNYKYLKANDPRLSAKVTAVLFDKGLKDKAHLLCLFLENPEMNTVFSSSDIGYTKKLLELDPELITTQKIVNIVKQQVGSTNLNTKLEMLVKYDLEKYLINLRARFMHSY